MRNSRIIRTMLVSGACAAALTTGSWARNFDIPQGDMERALDTYATQTGISLIVSDDQVKGVRSNGVKGNLPDNVALMRLLEGTGFVAHPHSGGAIGIVAAPHADISPTLELAQAAPASRAAVETVTVTSSKLGGADVQSIPISITALSQEQLTATQTAGGPDLVKQVPNLTFSKTNFSGYNLEIRGIGTQAISVTTDPAVAVALNDIPFIRNHFFEQEFYDLGQAEVLRGPQGTLYGRNATAGVVNLETAKPTDQFEALASVDIGNYQNRRFEGMINLPIVDDRVDLRVAGEWTKRQGYSFNEITDQRIDGRDLWSGRVTLGFKPIEELQTYLVWEHFSEDDDRMRSAKQLCKTNEPPASINGVPVPPQQLNLVGNGFGPLQLWGNYLSQGCEATGLYSPDAFEVPDGYSLPYNIALGLAGGGVNENVDPYASTTQSRNLRVIESTINPHYRAKNDTLELNTDYTIAPSLTFTSQTGYNQDFLWSTEDYNRFNTTAGTIANFCDPQLGCANRIVAEDLSDEHAWQLSQEFRLASNFSGPLNFSVGGNYLHYETEENYYVFVNALTIYATDDGNYAGANGFGGIGDGIPNDNSTCLQASHNKGYQNPVPRAGGGYPVYECIYIDPNPITSLNNYGHNYFLSQNPYTLNSYAAFGEAYYNIASDLKLTGGLRWTEDRKRFIDIPSEVVDQGYGYAITGAVNQQWDELTGRGVVNWTPKLDFTDQTLVYVSYSRGYKAGGANPPGAVFQQVGQSEIAEPVHPLTFKPEFIDAYELGSKNTLLDSALTLNGDVFYYDYKDYQISEIVDRTSINLNFSAKVKGAELESTYEPLPGLRFNFAGGWEDTRINNGQSAVDLMDRTAGMPGWMVVKPFVTQASNCILPDYVVAALLEEQPQPNGSSIGTNGNGADACTIAYNQHLDPGTLNPYLANPTGLGGLPYQATSSNGAFPIPSGYPGFDPVSNDPNAPVNVNNGLGLTPNNGEGFAKNLGGNKLPNAPPFTVSVGTQYTMPITSNWAGTLRSDYYWQDYSWARVFNDNPYDRLRGYTNINLTLIFTNQDGWQVMLYDKNVFNTTAITGDFLNSDDSGLTTNVFLTDPKLVGIRVTKNW